MHPRLVSSSLVPLGSLVFPFHFTTFGTEERRDEGHAVGGQDGGYTSFHLSLRSILDLAYGVYMIMKEKDNL